MKHLDLFSGIGGFALAIDKVFYEEKNEHIFCDNDKFCQAILKKHWPEAPIVSDIRRFTANPINNKHRPESGETSETNRISEVCRETLDSWRISGTDLLTGGFPCQPFSQAGRRKGTDDNRYLWPEMLRVIREFHPRWVIAENVRGLISWNEGMVFGQVCSDLESAGYEVQPFIIPAVAVNAPHRRDRVWFVAYRNDTGNRTPTSETDKDGTKKNEGRKGQPQFGTGGQRGNAPDTRQQYGKQGNGERVETDKTIGTARPTDAERQGENGGIIADSPSKGGQQRGQAKGDSTQRKEGILRRNDSNTSDSYNKGLEGRERNTNQPAKHSGGRNEEWNQNWLEVATRLCTLDDGLQPGLVRPKGWRNAALKAAGNAIVPQVAEVILRHIKAVDN